MSEWREEKYLAGLVEEPLREVRARFEHFISAPKDEALPVYGDLVFALTQLVPFLSPSSREVVEDSADLRTFRVWGVTGSDTPDESLLYLLYAFHEVRQEVEGHWAMPPVTIEQIQQVAKDSLADPLDEVFSWTASSTAR